MKITCETNFYDPLIFKIFIILTARATVCVDDIHYDLEKGIVNILMRRKEITGFKQTIFGNLHPIYGSNVVRPLLTIKQVEMMKLEVDDLLVSDCNSCFRPIWGLSRLTENLLYIGSLEESQGKTLAEIEIKFRNISIGYSDEMD